MDSFKRERRRGERKIEFDVTHRTKSGKIQAVIDKERFRVSVGSQEKDLNILDVLEQANECFMRGMASYRVMISLK